MESHHAGGGLRERVTMGNHLSDRQVKLLHTFPQFRVELPAPEVGVASAIIPVIFYMVALIEFCWHRMK